MNETISLGEKIRHLRKRMRLTQSELAGKDFSKSFISQVENGQTRPSIKSLQVIAERLNQPVSYFLDEPVSISQSDGTQSVVASLIEKGKGFQRSGDLIEALETYERARHMCAATDHHHKGEIWLRMGHVHHMQGRFERSRELFRLAIDEFRLTDNHDFLARSLNNLGTVEMALGQYSEALNAYREAMQEFENEPMENPAQRVTLLANIATVQAHLKRYADSIRVSQDALAYGAKSGMYFQHGKIYQILGFVHHALGDLNLAIHWTRKAADFFHSVDDIMRELHCLNNLISHYRESGAIDLGNAVARDIIKRASEINANDEIARAYFGLAEMAFDANQVAEAYSNIGTAIKYAPRHESLHEWVELISKCASREPIPNEIVEYVKRLPGRWKADPRKLAHIHSSLGKIYNQLGDPDKANTHFQDSNAIYRSLE